MKTKIISLYGGPGSGKTTLAAEIFTHLKRNQVSVELVHEWVKGWAWSGRVPQGVEDNLYILAKQLKAEKTVYGKVEYIVTDSPIGLPAVYEEMYNSDTTLVRNAVKELLRVQATEGKVERINLLVERRYAYVVEGRFQTLEKAQRIDEICKTFLGDDYTLVNDLGSALKAIDSKKKKVVDT